MIASFHITKRGENINQLFTVIWAGLPGEDHGDVDDIWFRRYRSHPLVLRTRIVWKLRSGQVQDLSNS